jgi:hypothetical protein
MTVLTQSIIEQASQPKMIEKLKRYKCSSCKKGVEVWVSISHLFFILTLLVCVWPYF